MALYLSAERVRTAIHRLGASRAKRTSLFDFLIVKRTLAIKGASAVAIAESEGAFIQALEELAATASGDEDHYYFNPFALLDGKTGYRPKRYRSNGPNTTIAGPTWRGIIDLNEEKPRKASLAKGYEERVAGHVLSGDRRKALPNLTDVAVWFWRGRDLENILAGLSTDAERLGQLTEKFSQEVDLTPTEVEAVFDSALDSQTTPDGSSFVTEPPSPETYLPVRSLPTAETKEENLSEVSFALVTALAAKNFAILTGPSGTGKSRAALKLAEGLQRYHAGQVEGSIFELVAVGPDWTSPKRLLGFRTPFGKERKLADGTSSNESYEITDAIRLLLRASHPDAANIPHFLIFDEMNLSHVERYFAPFLSLMEATSILDAESGISLLGVDDLKLIAAVLQAENPGSREAAAATSMIAEGRDFILPANLFFVGTVNVDETTYMFSPKVLDRAHVIELDAERPSDYLLADNRSEPGGTVNIGRADVALKRGIEARETRRFAVSNPATILETLSEAGLAPAEVEQVRRGLITALDGTYDLLSPVGFSFGYRISKEIFIFVTEWMITKLSDGTDKAAVMGNWQAALDQAVLQKILPKIHGNRRNLSDSLRALSAFYAGKDSHSSPSASYTMGLGTKVAISPEGKLDIASDSEQLPRSRKKLDAMHDRLQASGYVSFVS